ncbi:prepilin-type N-terminal cleavage/methylation domain-containing protein [Aneurinibacillus uraniidurans]|uniref:prepilin-type N-terminal cleavage/methylation domain-containing protein n=1 Tax=Aneurinibacillus uraniidurans TaxID=2966586 RepID=UPI002349FA3C|nr:prepilin-type N-terminal cleavage/methylation domain-containing protein [Aneurinibacillus sp. B1]WCN38551.1 prepilin-type N-terminal cleavage/methylation domain-containing protein [Aneurinibacillus sp. B1]
MFKRLREDQKGLTLIELLAVVVILGIIIAIAIPSISGIIERQKVKAHDANAAMVLDAAKMYYIDNPGQAIKGNSITLKGLTDGKYLDGIPKNPFTGKQYDGTTNKVDYADGGELQVTLLSEVSGIDRDYKGATRADVLADKYSK